MFVFVFSFLSSFGFYVSYRSSIEKKKKREREKKMLRQEMFGSLSCFVLEFSCIRRDSVSIILFIVENCFFFLLFLVII